MKLFSAIIIVSCLSAQGAGLVNGTLSPVPGTVSGGGATNAISSISGANVSAVYVTNSGAIAATLNLTGFPSNIIYTAPWGNDANGGTNSTAPLATLHQACTNIYALQAINPGILYGIYSLGGTNNNEISSTVGLADIIDLPPNISYNADPSSIWVLTNRSSRGINQQTNCSYITPSAGDIINNLRIRYTDSQQDSVTGGAFGAYQPTVTQPTVYNTIPSTNPCVVNNLYILSDSAGIHIEQLGGNTNINVVFNNPVVVSQGQCGYFYGIAGQVVLNNPTFTLTNWNPVRQPTNKGKPYRCIDCGTSTNTGYLVVHGGTLNYSDYNSNTNWPSCGICSVFNTPVGSSNAVFIGVVFNPLNTNVSSLDISTGYSIANSNSLLLLNCYRADGQQLSESNLGPVSLISPLSNVRSTNFQGKLTNVVVNGGYWTNNGSIGLLTINHLLTDSSVSGDPGLCITNVVSGQFSNLTNAFAVAGSVGGSVSLVMRTGDYLIATNQSSGNATATVSSSFFIPYP